MTFDRGCRYRIKSIGPRTDPYGTPWWREDGVECAPCIVIIWVLFSKYDWNQDSTVQIHDEDDVAKFHGQ